MINADRPIEHFFRPLGVLAVDQRGNGLGGSLVHSGVPLVNSPCEGRFQFRGQRHHPVYQAK